MFNLRDFFSSLEKVRTLLFLTIVVQKQYHHAITLSAACLTVMLLFKCFQALRQMEEDPSSKKFKFMTQQFTEHYSKSMGVSSRCFCASVIWGFMFLSVRRDFGLVSLFHNGIMSFDLTCRENDSYSTSYVRLGSLVPSQISCCYVPWEILVGWPRLGENVHYCPKSSSFGNNNSYIFTCES